MPRRAAIREVVTAMRLPSQAVAGVAVVVLLWSGVASSALSSRAGTTAAFRPHDNVKAAVRLTRQEATRTIHEATAHHQ